MTKTGTLFIVATPLGNLDDISPRAINTLNDVDIILAEDTRHASKLTNHLQIKTPLASYHDHNERDTAAGWVEKLKSGQSIALISDAGTPLISDPGYHIVHQAKIADVKVIAIPGPCALIAALSVSGLPTDAFHFAGFLPSKGEKRVKSLQQLMSLPATIVLYESPERLAGLLELICLIDDRQVAISRELTKLFEQNVLGKSSELIPRIGKDIITKGECVVLIEKGQEVDFQLENLLSVLLKEGLATKQASKIASKLTNTKQQDCYNMALKIVGKSCTDGT